MNGQCVRLPWPTDTLGDMSTLEEWIVVQSRMAATSDPVLFPIMEREEGSLLDSPQLV